MQDPQAAYDAELEKQLTEKEFTLEETPQEFDLWLKQALQYSNTRELKCSWDVFKALIAKAVHNAASPSARTPYNLLEVGNAINAIVFRTPFELGMGTDEYIQNLDQVHEMSAKWNKMADPVKNSVMRKVQALGRRGIHMPLGGAKH